MSAREPLVFKFANEDWEFEQIHRLNYKTFVEEIPQHKPSASPRLVDKFHAENTYLICLQNQKLAGMLAVRGNRPFSLDQKLPSLDSYLPSSRTICEIRLLAIEKKFRGTRSGQILQGILALLWQHGVEKGYDLAIISGTTRQSKLSSTSVLCPSARWSAPARRSSSRCMSRWKPSRSRRENFCAPPLPARFIPAR